MSDAHTQSWKHASIPAAGMFVALTLAIFTALVITLIAIDFYPEPIQQKVAGIILEEAEEAKITEEPASIIIDSISLSESVANPESTDIETLDAALLNGAVRYPGSAKVGEDGTMLIFGHSSHLPVIHNQAYKAFNGIGKLPKGTVIRVRSGTTEEVYRVSSVEMVKATDAVVSLEGDEKRLVLVTCNTFGDKADRYMVEARFVGSYPIPE